MNKDYMKETITFTAKDKDDNKVESTPHLFVESLAKAVGTTVPAVKSKISKSSSKFKNTLKEVLDEKRLPTGGELMSLTTILGTKKDKVEKAFAEIVKADVILSSNGTKASEVNTLNFQFTWPKNWGVRNEDIGEAICNLFRSEDFKNDAIFCNYTDSEGNPIDTIIIGADAGKFESAQSFGKLVDGFRTLLHHIYIDSPFQPQVDALDEPIYDLLDEDVYYTLYELAVNGSVEDAEPLQMYLYKKGILDLPNVKDDKVVVHIDTSNGTHVCNIEPDVDEACEPDNPCNSDEPDNSVKYVADRPTVTIKASNIDNSTIKTIIDAFDKNVDLEIEAVNVGNIVEIER